MSLDDARRHFGEGRLSDAEQDLSHLPDDRNAALYLMERGMIRHLRHDFAGSTLDWLQAVRVEEQLETHSATKAGASIVVNDNLLAFRGYPFERTYLHVFLARNYLSRGLWDDAAVEARLILRQLEDRDDFPDDAYSRYLAGFCLELTGDAESAQVQYRIASSLVAGFQIDERSGRFLAESATNLPSATASTGYELVCLVDIDGGNDWTADHAAIFVGDRCLGTTHTLANTVQLEWESRQRMALRRTAKEASRLALKASIAAIVANQNRDLGRLMALLLLATEAPDERHWSTLPHKLAIARVPCPPDLKRFDVEFKGFAGMSVRRITVDSPIARRDHVFFAYCRDYP